MKHVIDRTYRAGLPAISKLPKVLIVGGGGNVAWLWHQTLMDHGFLVTRVEGENDAIASLRHRAFDVILMDMIFQRGSVLAVSDFVNYRHPETKLVFVNSGGFLADGTIFALCSNACAMIPAHSKPSDVAAVVAHYSGVQC